MLVKIGSKFIYITTTKAENSASLYWEHFTEHLEV